MNIFKDLKIGSRLLVSLSFLIILLLGMAALSIWSIYSINQSMADAVTEFKKFQVAYDVNNQINGITIDVSDMIVAGDPAQVKIFQAEIDTHRAAYQKDMVYLKAAATTGTGKQLLASLEAAIAALRTENDLSLIHI